MREELGTEANCSNRSTGGEQCHGSDGRFPFLQVALLGSVFVVAAFGNLLFLHALWKKRKRNSRTQLFLLHLCIADLLLAFFQVLPQLFMGITPHFRGSDVACRAVKYLQVVGMSASAYLIVAMTVERYNAVCRPSVSFFRGSLRRYVAIGAAWATALAFSCPQLFIFSLREMEEHVYDCQATFIDPWGSEIYITWVTLSVFVCPAVILLFCQIQICTGIYLNMKRKSLQTAAKEGRSASKGVSKTMLKTVKMTFVIIVVHMGCWSPFFLVQLWSTWNSQSAQTEAPAFIVTLLASLSCCTNPWIYLYYS
ncbi:arginine vasopressin receptor 2, like [Brienomyrus brachyistius]|uniref:arginine vasopressin receptor 2, like n=1 Tax=Brienomyrus brachyistius TaxID=42636 RepID=UPI0020B240BD|nr:arginine vasopressin receptor 2, like [Brienomyrus brachyistius]